MIAALLLGLTAAPLVTTDAGPLRGEATADGRALFRGIPFAAAPVGGLRWRPPAPVARWRSVRDAMRSAPACPQIDYGWNHGAAANQSEDCLYLEVGTPALKPSALLPVMVWIHGGGNRAGGGAGTIESPLVRRGVVLVSIQYRLNALGFLSHPALGRTSGNYALMDQQAALRWVRRNIEAFGGDPANVTIFGESAGAQDVGLQILSPGARGLFAKAIEQSGTPGFGEPSRSLADNERLGALLVAKAGSAPNADAAALRRLPAQALVQASETVDVPGLDDDSFIWLQAVVDGTVLTEPPAVTLARGAGARVPLIIGSNARELSLHGDEAGVVPAITRAFGPQAKRAMAFYGLAGTPRAIDDPHLGTRTEQIADDITFRCPGLVVARRRAEAGVPVWHYQFDGPGAGGAPVTHGSDIRYVLGDAGAAADTIAPMAAYWAAFARTGSPSGDGLPAWPRYRPEDRVTMSFGMGGPAVVRDLRAPICGLRDAP